MFKLSFNGQYFSYAIQCLQDQVYEFLLRVCVLATPTSCRCLRSCALIPERDELFRRRLWVSASCSTSLSVFAPILILHHEMCMSLSRHERCRLGVSVIRARYARVRNTEREDASWGDMVQRACTKDRTKENGWRKGEGGQKSVGVHVHTHVPVQFFS